MVECCPIVKLEVRSLLAGVREWEGDGEVDCVATVLGRHLALPLLYLRLVEGQQNSFSDGAGTYILL